VTLETIRHAAASSLVIDLLVILPRAIRSHLDSEMRPRALVELLILLLHAYCLERQYL
jgi:hypothetical protein